MRRRGLLVFGLWVVLLAGPMSGVRGDVVFVSSLGGDEVLRYDATTGVFIDTFIPVANNGGLSQPHGILERCNDLLVCSFGTDSILIYDRQSGAPIGVFADATSGLSQPTYIIYGPDGMVYVSSQGSDEILRYTAGGAFVDAFVTAGSGGLNGPSGFAFGADGRFYVAGRFSANVIAYDGMTGAFSEVIASAADGLGAGNTFGLTFGDNGDLYFASAGVVFHYDLNSASIVNTIAVSAIGVEAGVSGGVFVATGNNLRVIDTADDSVSALFLNGGGVISTLNFFRFVAPTPPPDCTAPVPTVSTGGLALIAIVIFVAGAFVLRGPLSYGCV